MISLNIQFLSLFVSFLYGFVVYILLEVNYKFLMTSNLVVRVIMSMFFILFITLLYFIILLCINNGYIHIYFFISVLCGYFVCKVVYKWFVNKFLLWYTKIKKSR